MHSGLPRVVPLRANGRLFECFLEPGHKQGRRVGNLSIHRKSDGLEVARGRLHISARRVRLGLTAMSPGLAFGPIVDDLAPVLSKRYPRHGIEVVMADRRQGPAGSGPLRAPARVSRIRRARPDPAARRLAAVRAEVPGDYGPERQLLPQREPQWLVWVGPDHAGRPCWLAAGARVAWLRLEAAARDDGVSLVLVSGFRSADYQARILAAKRARGLSMDMILTVNAAPGYSEHHSGRALDLSTPGCAPAAAEFESTAAYRWLEHRAGEFGFRMSYPAGNPHGIVPEPWHWYFLGN